ncbi:MAG: hypothetical protein COA70_09035 [Planctomycetota bacterium]|nr:MAG: hypothetical protein COA70_09035 [Planctomycetota bacterium]
MRLGVNLAVFGDRSLQDGLRECADHGLENVELPVHQGGSFALRQAREVHDFGLKLSALDNHVDSHNLLSKDAGLAQMSSTFFAETMEMASDLGVEIVTCFFGEDSDGHWFGWPDIDARKRCFERFASIWIPILDRAQELGLVLAHEPHPRQTAFDLESCLRLQEAVNHHSALGWNLDAGNLLISASDPVVFVEQMGARVVHMHAKDFLPAQDAAQRDWRFAIAGWGVTDWLALYAALEAKQLDPVWSLEHEDPTCGREDGVRKGLSFLRGVAPSANKMEVWW